MLKVAKFEKVSKNLFCEALKAEGDFTQEQCEQIYDAIRLPKRATSGSAGYDFYAPYAFCLKANETIKIPTGIRVKIEDGYFLGLFPRSSLGFKYRMHLNNTVGIIDSDYYYSNNEGHIFIKLSNGSDKTIEIKAQDGIVQGIFMPFMITYDDHATDVRNGGFGSTNEK